MAELLILAFDTFGLDEVADRMAWKLGHIIDVKPDGHLWGDKEGLPKFWKIKLPGIAVDTVRKFLDAKLDFTNPEKPTKVGTRKWRLGVNDIPVPVRNALVKTGVYEVKNQVLQTIEEHMKLV